MCDNVSSIPIEAAVTSCNWSLQPFSKDYDLATHITYVLYANFIREWLILYSLTSTPNDSFLRNFCILFFYSQSFRLIFAVRK